jgi:hypothetical protein
VAQVVVASFAPVAPGWLAPPAAQRLGQGRCGMLSNDFILERLRATAWQPAY